VLHDSTVISARLIFVSLLVDIFQRALLASLPFHANVSLCTEPSRAREIKDKIYFTRPSVEFQLFMILLSFVSHRTLNAPICFRRYEKRRAMRDASQSIGSGATGASSQHVVPFDGALLSYLPAAARKRLHGTADHPRASVLSHIS